MYATSRHRQHRPPSRAQVRGPLGAPMWWGWSPQSGQMEMMDLRGYIDSVRAGYDRALEDLYQRVQAVSDMMSGASQAAYPGSAYSAPAYPAPTRPHPHHRHHDHDHDCGHHRHHDHDCGHHKHHHEHHRHDHHGCEHGCGEHDDCRCECCIVDADVVVYARCGEIRVVPIEIANDTRKARENVTLEVSDVRSAGGRALPWKTLLQPAGPITIEGCSCATIELLVQISCAEPSTPSTDKPTGKGSAAQPAAADTLLRLASEQRRTTGDIDSCEVGYTTIRAGGCLVRPIVVAIAVLPDDCGRYHTGCSCSCCC